MSPVYSITRDHTSFFVDLNRGLVAIDSDNFADEVIMTDFDLSVHPTDRSSISQGIIIHGHNMPLTKPTYKLVHGDTNHVLGDNDGAA